MSKRSSFNPLDIQMDGDVQATYSNIEKVASIKDDISKLAVVMNQNVDFSILAKVLTNLNDVSANKLSQIATANLIEITKDLAKGNYLGNRKMDIDLSKNIGADGKAIYYEKATIVTTEGISIDIPFLATDGVTIEQTSSPSRILTHIQNGITNYNTNEPNAQLHVVGTEYDLLNETIINLPTIIRIRDTDIKPSNIVRVVLKRWQSSAIDIYFWAKTTSALQTLSDRVADIIKMGNSIDSIIALSTKTDEIQYMYNNRAQLTDNADSIYIEMSKLVTLYNNITGLIDIYTHITNINSVAGDLTNIDNVATNIVPNLTTILDTPNQAAAAQASAGAAAQSETNASTSATTATEQATIATQKNQEIKSISVKNTTTGAAGTFANVIYDNVNNAFTFVVPKGDKGNKGDPFTVNSLGHTADKALYDAQLTGFSFLDLDTSLIYFKNSSTSGDWTAGVPFGKGDTGATGATGNGVASITFTSTTDVSGSPAQSGATDTYTITYTDATTSTFTVHNGLDSAVLSVAGKTGAVVLVKADVGLGNVDNTSDLDKPISNAVQAALGFKEAAFNYKTIAADTTAVAMDALNVDTRSIAQVDDVTIVTAVDANVYAVSVDATVYSYTAGTGSTLATIANGLAALIPNGVSDGISKVTVTATTAGTAQTVTIDATTTVSTDITITNVVANKAGPITITLPATPLENDVIGFLDAKGTFDTNSLSVARNGKLIMGLAQDMVVSTKNISFDLIYINGDWRLL